MVFKLIASERPSNLDRVIAQVYTSHTASAMFGTLIVVHVSEGQAEDRRQQEAPVEWEFSSQFLLKR